MAVSEQSTSCSYEITNISTDESIIHLFGRMDVDSSGPILSELKKIIKSKSLNYLTINMEKVSYLDDFGAFVLLEIKQLLTDRNGIFNIINANGNPKEILSMVKFDTQENYQPLLVKRSKNIFVSLGEETINLIFNTRYMISFIGSVVISIIHVILHPKDLRFNDTITHMKKTGVDALPIVALISLLLGLIMAFMSSIQLRQFGANIYVASLVALAMVSELGPIITAIIVAGRSGSAFAAEIGTMQISEEIDALFTMGFNPTLFLVIPRLFASIIVLPLLTLFSNVFGILGGLIVGILLLKLTANAYISQTIDSLALKEVVWGAVKSVIFASLITWVGCLRGYQARGGASAVGNAATSAVVSSIFLIILFDSIIAVIRSYWG